MAINVFQGFRTTLLCASVALAYSGAVYAEAQVQNVKLNDVTVFIRGAELFNSGKVTLPAGESEVIFTNIDYCRKYVRLRVGYSTIHMTKTRQLT